MEMRFLGRSGLKVSALGFGAMTFAASERGWARIGETQGTEAQRQVDLSLEAGINFFDTADQYDQGRSEEILGQALGERRRDVIIATKGFFATGQAANDVGLGRRHLIEACEASLRRLGTDWIDLYQLHQFDAATPLEETLHALEHLVSAGKVRYVGCSNFFAWQLMKSLALADRLGFQRFIGHQFQYSLMVRDAEDEILPCGVDQGVGGVIWGAVAAGFLSGKFSADREATGARLANDPRLADYGVRGPPVLAAIAEIAEAHDASPTQVALNWVIRRPGVTCALVGARTTEQLVDNLKAATWSLSQAEIERLDRASQGPRRRYPDSHQRGMFGDRNPTLFPYYG
jgi:aryl-alcohol dehydrogenase-like predicted oxidoreductase